MYPVEPNLCDNQIIANASLQEYMGNSKAAQVKFLKSHVIILSCPIHLVLQEMLYCVWSGIYGIPNVFVRIILPFDLVNIIKLFCSTKNKYLHEKGE